MKFFNLSDYVNLLSIIGAVLLLVITFYVVWRMFNQMKVATQKFDTTGEEWDGIKEQSHPVPSGWSVSFLLLMLWGLWYMFLGYPLAKYSQVGEYNEEVASYNARYEAVFANASQEQLTQMGEQFFIVQCSQCHGITGDGISGKAQDLTRWGTEDGIIDTITKGSKGMGYELGEMIPNETFMVAEGEDTLAVAAYVAAKISKIGTTKNPHLLARGEEVWMESCMACHGETGENEGAPNLRNYGSAEFVVEVLNRGKMGFIGNMPKFTGTGLMNSIQAQGVGEYITKLKGE